MSEIDILDYIPIGKKNAVGRTILREFIGVSDRELRDMIHHARRKIPILNLSDGNGYYIPDMNTEEGVRDLVRFVRQEESRLKSIGWALQSARKTLCNCGIDWRSYDKQQDEGKERGTGTCRST